ncbi:MAG: sulfite exporter TauE/SafE family protein [Candidatus Omnitrophica bacterium]|nr:sulfite exporter TauE/SafE family protein [Candidatus Omnitrophota bacterium]
MGQAIVCAVAFASSMLTFFSGFGLGTLLLPALAPFFPIDMAIAMTAIVHLLNNLFKFILVGKHADRSIIFQFGLPAIFAALMGAFTLSWLSSLPPLLTYPFFSRHLEILPVKLTVSILMIFFSFLEIVPRSRELSFEKKYLSLGGILSGFFGGLSGHQGAFRSAFLIRCGLPKESFIATSIVIACLVDLSRIPLYGVRLFGDFSLPEIQFLFSVILSAFLGAFLGNLYLKKLAMRDLQRLVAFMLFGVAIALGAGLI